MKDKDQNSPGTVKEVTLNDVCKEVLNGHDGIQGCAVLDLQSGLVLGVSHKLSGFNDAYIEAIAAAAVDLFRGPTVKAVENLLGSHFGKKTQNAIQELQVTTADGFTFLSVVPGKPQALFLMATDKSLTLGLGWTLIRSNLGKVLPYCP
ncbi:MAG: hypothetical protein H6696_20730 [Deferribacteres bacterium]|nr:hypothetical protein [candidate division KSB1 bacterium]MCB9504358.1 hypothetical protein [Deferribacteres bacterium]